VDKSFNVTYFHFSSILGQVINVHVMIDNRKVGKATVASQPIRGEVVGRQYFLASLISSTTSTCTDYGRESSTSMGRLYHTCSCTFKTL